MTNNSSKPVSGEAVDTESLNTTAAVAYSAAAKPDDPALEAARAQADEDRKWFRDNPGRPLIRGRNKDVGGE